MPAARRVAIVGMGLIGGSIGLALRKHHPVLDVVGVTRTEATAELARARGAAHTASTRLADIGTADLVMLACPLGVQARVLEECLPHLAEGARVTDVGSVKGSVVRHAKLTLNPDRNPFLGGHPMAGKETGGIENADADLFAGRVWAFTPDPGGERWPAQFADLVQLVRDLGADPISLPPETHDRYVALVSHLPFLLSTAMLDAAGASPAWGDAVRLAASGFRDMTRLGGGDPEMYAAIVEQNREAVLDGWARLQDVLNRVEAAITRGEKRELKALFSEAREVRHAWLEGTTPPDPA